MPPKAKRCLELKNTAIQQKPWHLEFSNSIPRYLSLKPAGTYLTFHVVHTGHLVRVNCMKVGQQLLCMGILHPES